MFRCIWYRTTTFLYKEFNSRAGSWYSLLWFSELQESSNASEKGAHHIQVYIISQFYLNKRNVQVIDFYLNKNYVMPLCRPHEHAKMNSLGKCIFCTSHWFLFMREKNGIPNYKILEFIVTLRIICLWFFGLILSTHEYFNNVSLRFWYFFW